MSVVSRSDHNPNPLAMLHVQIAHYIAFSFNFRLLFLYFTTES